MDIQKEYEQELVFKIEAENKEGRQIHRQKKVFKMASENLKKIVIDKLDGKTGEC